MISPIVRYGSLGYFLVKNPITMTSDVSSIHETYLSMVSMNIYYACAYEAPLMIQSQFNVQAPYVLPRTPESWNKSIVETDNIGYT